MTGQEVELWSGSSYFGSGGYSAGWRVVEGEVEEIPIAGSTDDNGFLRRTRYSIRPKSEWAVLKAWNGDGISSSGWRSLGRNGIIVLAKPGVQVPPLCPECGHTATPGTVCAHCKHLIPVAFLKSVR